MSKHSSAKSNAALNECLVQISEKKKRIEAAMATFSPEQQKVFKARLYQYSQDVGRGGTDPEMAAASRDLVFWEGRHIPVEVAARIQEMEQKS